MPLRAVQIRTISTSFFAGSRKDKISGSAHEFVKSIEGFSPEIALNHCNRATSEMLLVCPTGTKSA